MTFGDPSARVPVVSFLTLLEKPDPSGISDILWAAGLPLDEVMGNVEATVLTVTE